MLIMKYALLGAAMALALQAGARTVPTEQTQGAVLSRNDVHHPLWAQKGMVASQEAQASAAGLEMLRQGGNAVDAGVAVGFALAVTLPRAGNIGGGGFMIVHDAQKGETVAIDYREKAPASAFRDMYLDEKGEVISERSPGT